MMYKRNKKSKSPKKGQKAERIEQSKKGPIADSPVKKFKRSKQLSFLKDLISKAVLTLSLSLTGTPCFAATADAYQFTGALYSFMKEIQGAPIAIVVCLGIIFAGFFMIAKNHDIAIRQVICALVGGGLVIAAPNLITMIPGMQGAVI